MCSGLKGVVEFSVSIEYSVPDNGVKKFVIYSS